jgi:carotenoid cleavage dioxygenase-like enzyme
VDPARESLETLWSGRTISEFPNVDPRRWGTRAEVLWSNAFSSDTAAASGPQDALLRVDHAAGTETLIPLDPGCYPSEPILARDRAGAPWVLSMVLDSRAGASWLGIWSEAGALTAQVEMGQALPIAFHGSYISAAG